MSRETEIEGATRRGMGPAPSEQQRMVGKASAPDFLDSALEGRRLFAEAWGTFLLVLVAAGGGVIAARTGSILSSGARAVAPGIMVMVIIYTMGAVSGAHLNPAVTLAFALRRHFPWRRVPGYLLAQLIGGVMAALFLRATFGTAGALGATLPGIGIGPARALVMEILLTAGLVNVILGTASGARNIGTNGAIAVGGYIALAHILAAPVCGPSMNPVRSLAPDLVRGDFATTWIYLVGPFVGAAIGVGFEWIIKGRPTVAGTIAAQGMPGRSRDTSQFPAYQARIRGQEPVNGDTIRSPACPASRGRDEGGRVRDEGGRRNEERRTKNEEREDSPRSSGQSRRVLLVNP